MADKRKYSFVEVHDSKGGKTALRFALLSAACFVACVLISFLNKGDAGPIVGAIAIGGMLLSAYGFRTGMVSFGEKDVSPAYSVIGSILSGVVTVGWLTLLLTGVTR